MQRGEYQGRAHRCRRIDPAGRREDRGGTQGDKPPCGPAGGYSGPNVNHRPPQITIHPLEPKGECGQAKAWPGSGTPYILPSNRAGKTQNPFAGFYLNAEISTPLRELLLECGNFYRRCVNLYERCGNFYDLTGNLYHRRGIFTTDRRGTTEGKPPTCPPLAGNCTILPPRGRAEW